MDLENQVAIVDVDAECLEALEERMFERSKVAGCYNMVRTPTLCKPYTLDRPYYFLSTYLI
jgi:hypothetical protein